MRIVHARDYREARREEYPAIGDQLDAIWKFLRLSPVSDEVQKLLDEIDCVKAKYPKNPL